MNKLGKLNQNGNSFWDQLLSMFSTYEKWPLSWQLSVINEINIGGKEKRTYNNGRSACCEVGYIHGWYDPLCRNCSKHEHDGWSCLRSGCYEAGHNRESNDHHHSWSLKDSDFTKKHDKNQLTCTITGSAIRALAREMAISAASVASPSAHG